MMSAKKRTARAYLEEEPARTGETDVQVKATTAAPAAPASMQGTNSSASYDDSEGRTSLSSSSYTTPEMGATVTVAHSSTASEKSSIDYDDDLSVGLDHDSKLHAAPTGQPLNFGVVVPGVYRSSFPKEDDYDFLKNLHLKTVVTLVQKDFPASYEPFLKASGIKHYIFNMKGTKKEEIPLKTMKDILRLVLDRQNHPLLIHCNHGKHRTGCVVAVVRKVSGWDLKSILEEYKSYANPKVRECDTKYIADFEPASLSASFSGGSSSPPLSLGFRVRTFFRATFFTFFVLILWIISGTRMENKSEKHQLQQRYTAARDVVLTPAPP